MSHSIQDFEEFRRTDDVGRFTDEWLQEARRGEVTGSRHMNLLAWTKIYPHQALAIILELLDKTENDDATQECIAMGEVTRIVEWPADDFLPYLVHAVQTHRRFALCTKSQREHSGSGRWKRLQQLICT
jgi:hypothetical protein